MAYDQDSAATVWHDSPTAANTFYVGRSDITRVDRDKETVRDAYAADQAASLTGYIALGRVPG